MRPRIIAKNLLAQVPILDGLFRRFVWSRVFFPEREMQFLDALPSGAIDVALDVGAAQGSYAWILARKARQVFAFEPGDEHYRYLRRMALGTNIEVTKAAVGGGCSVVELYTPGSDDDARHSATLSLANPAAGRTGARVDLVDQVTLDSFLADRLTSGQSVDVLKVDVEGYELEVFRGGAGILARHHPLVLCEIEARHNPEYGKVFELLRGAGYRCCIHRGVRFEPFDGERVEPLQSDRDRDIRLSGDFDPRSSQYINNFVFQHPNSRIKAMT
jgi:FkbM family methyltransferase